MACSAIQTLALSSIAACSATLFRSCNRVNFNSCPPSGGDSRFTRLYFALLIFTARVSLQCSNKLILSLLRQQARHVMNSGSRSRPLCQEAARICTGYKPGHGGRTMPDWKQEISRGERRYNQNDPALAVSGWANLLADLLRDVKFGLRSMTRAPSFSLFAILALALASGASTTVFTIVNTLLLHPLPAQDPSRLVSLY